MVTTYARGFDCWGVGPSAEAAAQAGMRFRTWYSSRDSSKDGTKEAIADYAAHGLWSVTNFETTATRVLDGYDAGLADARAALAEYVAYGMPRGAAVYFSADQEIGADRFADVVRYYEGARDGLHPAGYLTGCYGEQALIAHLLGAGVIDVGGWRSMSTAWPGGTSSVDVAIVQVDSGTIGEVSVDFDIALAPFFGQWQPGVLAPTAGGATTPPPTRIQTPEEDMSASSDSNGRAGLAWAAGSRHVAEIVYDAMGGPLTLRPVFHLTSGPLVPADHDGKEVLVRIAAPASSAVLEIPPAIIQACRGITFTPVGEAPGPYYIVAA